MANWKKLTRIIGGGVVAAGAGAAAVIAAPFVATTAVAVGTGAAVGCVLGVIASTLFDDIKLVFLMQGEGGSGKTTIIEVLTNKSMQNKETTSISMELENHVKFEEIGFIDVAANDLKIKEDFASLDIKARKAILFVFDAFQYTHGAIEEVQKAIRYYQSFCEKNNLLLFAIGTRGDSLSDEEKNEIKKEILDLSSSNSNKSKVAVQVVDARKKDCVYEAIKSFCNQVMGGN